MSDIEIQQCPATLYRWRCHCGQAGSYTLDEEAARAAGDRHHNEHAAVARTDEAPAF